MDKIEEVARRHVFPQAIPNSIAHEKSILSMSYWEACEKCKGRCCTNGYGSKRNINNLMNEYDKAVMTITFPEFMSYEGKGKVKSTGPKNLVSEDRAKYYSDIIYCDFNTDTGCIIPEGRPSICVTHVCTAYSFTNDLGIPYEIEEHVLRGHSRVSRALSGILPPTTWKSKEGRFSEDHHMREHYDVDDPQIEDRIIYVNSLFKKSEEIINSHDEFKIKFNPTPIVMPKNI